MPKNSKEQIESDEKKVIKELQRNSKESIDKISRKCGFSRQKVWRIIKKLEKDKTIWGYSAVIDDEKLGMKRYFVLIKRKFNHVSKEKIDLITKRTLKKEAAKIGIDLQSSYFVYGSFDWLLSINAKNIKHVKRFHSVIANLFSDDSIADIEVLEVVFPIEKNNNINPNIEEFKEFFS